MEILGALLNSLAFARCYRPKSVIGLTGITEVAVVFEQVVSCRESATLKCSLTTSQCLGAAALPYWQGRLAGAK